MDPPQIVTMPPPLLLIDIDGVISLFGFDPERPPPGRFLLVDGIPHFVSTTAAELLHALEPDFELVWCSGWEEKADQYLPLELGLPGGLHHLTFGEPSVLSDAFTASAADAPGLPVGDGHAAPARHWKLAAIDAYAGPERPLAWIDDAFDESCRAWASDRSGPTLLVATDPATGLAAAHAGRLRDWARRVRVTAR
ncbi:MAG: HAD domain-containing protein [Solirubrobacteraceae bacterium]